MKTAATIDVTIPENRKLEVELPPEVPVGKASLVLIDENAARRSGEPSEPEAVPCPSVAA
jgi:hypothetical protein